MKEVSYDEFLSFVKNYKGTLKSNISGISEPPFVGYYDFKRGKGWDALVASYHLYDDKNKRRYRILENG